MAAKGVNLGDFDSVVINQPVGLGDIIFVHGIIDWFVSHGKSVLFPVDPRYYDAVQRHMAMYGVQYTDFENYFPFKEYFDSPQFLISSRILYVPLTFSYLYFPGCPNNISKYLLLNRPIGDWRSKLKIIRNQQREAKLRKEIHLPHHPYAFINRTYGTPPNTLKAAFEAEVHPTFTTFELDLNCRFSFTTTPFDYIGLLLEASELHLVESSLCYLADYFYPFSENKMHCYDRRTAGESPKYLVPSAFVYRHPSWIFHPC